MNWVGGSRDRCKVKSDMKKQREFFQKKKMQQRMKDAGLPTAWQGKGAGSSDLVTMCVVNQIATKKEKHCEPKITYLNKVRGVKKPLNGDPVELPMSPCSPSELCLEESHSPYSDQRLDFRTTRYTSQLSPVWESSFSESSVSNHQHLITDPLSPFSSCTSGSMSGTYSIQHRTEFVPSYQPGRDREQGLWAPAPDWSCQTHNNPVSRAQFGNMEPRCLEKRGSALQIIGGQLGFTLENKEDNKQMADMSFDNRTPACHDAQCEREVMLNSLGIQGFNKSQNSFWSQVPESTGQYGTRNSLYSCGTPSCSSKDGFLSTDSDDEEDSQWHRKNKSQGAFCVDEPPAARPVAKLYGRIEDPDAPGEQNKRTAADSSCNKQSLLREGSSQRKSTGDGQIVLTPQPQGCHRLLRKWPVMTQEVGTQTDSHLKFDVSVQCSLGQEHDTHRIFWSGLATEPLPVHHALVEKATRWQPAHTEELLESRRRAGNTSEDHKEHLRDVLGGHASLSGGTRHYCKPKELPAPATSCVLVNSAKDKPSPGHHEEAEPPRSSAGISQHLAQEPAGRRSAADGRDLGREGSAFWEMEDTATLSEIAGILVMMKESSVINT